MKLFMNIIKIRLKSNKTHDLKQIAIGKGEIFFTKSKLINKMVLFSKG